MLYSGTVLNWQNNIFSVKTTTTRLTIKLLVACSVVVQVSIKTSKLCQKSVIKYSTINSLRADFASSFGNTNCDLKLQNPWLKNVTSCSEICLELVAIVTFQWKQLNKISWSTLLPFSHSNSSAVLEFWHIPINMCD